MVHVPQVAFGLAVSCAEVRLGNDFQAPVATRMRASGRADTYLFVRHKLQSVQIAIWYG